MKKLVLALLILLLITCTACSKEGFTFDMPEWMDFGMEKEDVIANYNDEPTDYDNGIMYTDNKYNDNNTSDSTYTIEYGFEENKLNVLDYKLEFNSDDLMDRPYLLEYDYIKSEITNIYGEPLHEEEMWFDEQYKDDEDMINEAIEKGDYLKVTLWQVDDLYISLVLHKDIDIAYANYKNHWFAFAE